MEILPDLNKVGDLLSNLSIFNNINSKESDNYSRLFNSWEAIVGKKIADYSRIRDLDNNSLIVEADHPAIIQLIQLNYQRFIAKLNQRYPELKISDIRILLKDKSLKLQNKRITNDKSEKKSIDLSSIEDNSFKELLFKMKKRSQL